MNVPNRSLFIVFLLLVGLTEAAGQFDDGFMGNKWGTPFARMRETFDLKLILQADRTQQYRTNVERIAGIDISSCDFEFTQGRFTGVIIITQEARQSHRLLALLQSIFGPGHEEDPLGYQWFCGRTYIAYDESRDGHAYIYSYCLTLAGM